MRSALFVYVLALTVSLTGVCSYAADKTGYFGVTIGATEKGGAIVSEVVSGSPADQLGMRPGYIIMGVRAQPVKNADEAAYLLGQSIPGRWYSIYYAVDGILFAGLYTVASPLEFLLTKSFALPARGRIGATLDNYSTDQIPGVKVVNVNLGEFAAAAGLRAGDVIIGLGGRKVESLEDAFVAIANAAGRVLSVRFIRNDSVLSTEVAAAKSFEVVTLEISQEDLATARSAAASSNDQKWWCERSALHAATCIAAGIVGAGVAAAILGGRKDPRPNRGGDTTTVAQPEEPRVLRLPDPPPLREQPSGGPYSAPAISPYYDKCHGQAIGLGC